MSSIYLILNFVSSSLCDVGVFSTDDDRSVREGSISRKTQERWKVGAKKALLQWVQAQVGDEKVKV